MIIAVTRNIREKRKVNKSADGWRTVYRNNRWMIYDLPRRSLLKTYPKAWLTINRIPYLKTSTLYVDISINSTTIEYFAISKTFETSDLPILYLYKWFGVETCSALIHFQKQSIRKSKRKLIILITQFMTSYRNQ